MIALYVQGLLKMRRCFVVPAAIVHGNAQAVLYDEIRWSDRERMLK
jgi:hypothetical protein